MFFSPAPASEFLLQGKEYFVSFIPLSEKRKYLDANHEGGQYEVEIRFHNRFDGYLIVMDIRRFLPECNQHVRVGGKSRPGFDKLVGRLY
jgi:hypothetical protein